MRRREFITLLGGTALVGSRGAWAQQGTMPIIGFLSPRSSSDSETSFSAFRAGLRELGYVEGRSIAIEARFADGRYELLRQLAEQLVAAKVDIIVAVASPAVRAAQAASSNIPIVIGGTGDAVGSGLVTSLARPGGNTTGLSNLMSDIITKHFQLLMTVLPKLSRLAVLLNPGSSTRTAVLKSIEDAARTQHIIVMPIDVRNSDDIDHGFVEMRKEGAEALIVVADAFIISQLQKIAALGFQLKLPSVFEFREFPEAGGLFSYGTNQKDVYRRAATYVDKILKGAKPADLPVEQPTKFEFIINLKTARSFGIEIPPKLLFTADEVIE
jgi:putative ABC transport system substrate-binding protein